MARQSRSRAAPRPAASSQQTRGAHSAALPASAAPSSRAATAPTPPHAASQTAQPQQPGMLAQMAATAGSVAVGSTIGHGLSSMLFGGGGNQAAPVQEQAPVQAQRSEFAGASCEGQAKEFTKCLEKADLPSCSWYLDQLKACQAAAAPY